MTFHAIVSENFQIEVETGDCFGKVADIEVFKKHIQNRSRLKHIQEIKYKSIKIQ